MQWSLCHSAQCWLFFFGCSDSPRVFLLLACQNTMHSNWIILDFLYVKGVKMNCNGFQRKPVHIATCGLVTRLMLLLFFPQNVMVWLWHFLRGVAMWLWSVNREACWWQCYLPRSVLLGVRQAGIKSRAKWRPVTGTKEFQALAGNGSRSVQPLQPTSKPAYPSPLACSPTIGPCWATLFLLVLCGVAALFLKAPCLTQQ